MSNERVDGTQDGTAALRDADLAHDDAPEVDPDATLLDVVSDLRRDVQHLEMPLRTPGTEHGRDVRLALLGQIDDHLLPRLRELSRPAVVVVVGSTGAGKSTLVNSLVGAEVSRASVIRPTTREPVLVHHPADAGLLGDAVLEDALRVAHESVPRGLCILDAPDLDSLLRSNRETAARLLAVADVGLFVTTASRYGDALPWHVLSAARERGATMAMVLNRAPDATVAEVRVDLLDRLREYGMQSTPLFIVPDAGPHEGLLPAKDVAGIRRWLSTIAGAEQARRLILRTLRGALSTLPAQVEDLAAVIEDQAVDASSLRAEVAAHASVGVPVIERAVADGTLDAGALVAAWQSAIETDPGILRASTGFRAPSARRVRRREESLAPVLGEAERAVARLLVRASEVAGQAIGDAIAGEPGLPGGAALRDVVAGDPEIGAWRERTAVTTAAGWTAAVGEHLADRADEAAVRRARRRVGVEGLRVVTVVAALGNVGAQRMLDGLLGASASDVLADVRADLVDRGRAVVLEEEGPYAERLDLPSLQDEAATPVRLRLAELRRLV